MLICPVQPFVEAGWSISRSAPHREGLMCEAKNHFRDVCTEIIAIEHGQKLKKVNFAFNRPFINCRLKIEGLSSCSGFSK